MGKRMFYAAINSGGNTKLGSTIGTFSKLKGNREYYIPEYNRTVRGSCGCFGEVCQDDCYVGKSYVRHTCAENGHCSVKKGHARNTIALREDLGLSFEEMDGQLKRKRKPYSFVRIDQSGELLHAEEFFCWCGLALNHEESGFYIYSKAYAYMEWALLHGLVPAHFTVLYSIWHEYGLEEYKRVAHLPNVKAFVYLDKNKDINGWGVEEYAAHGLDVTILCPAYDFKGKMNHAITCDHCQFCMNRILKCKVIGTWAH